MAFQIYDMAKTGMGRDNIAQAVGVNPTTLKAWMKTHPEVEAAVRLGRGVARGPNATAEFFDFVYKRMSREQQELWDEMHAIDRDKDERHVARKKLEKLFRGRDTRFRQSMFLHALVKSNFNVSEACRMVNVPMGTVSTWGRDPKFAKLMDEIEEHKKNFFENALVKKVKEGDTAAVLFVNRTKNKDRGYGDGKVEVEHTHTFRQNVNLDELDIPADRVREILDAVREKNRRQLALNAAKTKFPVLNFFVPFTTIAGAITDNALDYMPISSGIRLFGAYVDAKNVGTPETRVEYQRAASVQDMDLSIIDDLIKRIGRRAYSVRTPVAFDGPVTTDVTGGAF